MLNLHLQDGFSLSFFQSTLGRDCVGRTIQRGLEEIELIVAGEGYYDWENHRHVCRRGTMLWHLSGEVTIFRNHPQQPYACLLFIYPVREPRPRHYPKITHVPVDDEFDHFVADLPRQFHRDGIDRDLLGLAAYSRLLWWAHLGTMREPVDALPRAIRHALEQIETHFAEPLGVPEIARRAGVSAVHLHALCRQHLGQTPHQLLVARRLQEARHLLAASERQIKDIGNASGFPDTVHFCRTFKSREGRTPAAYRAQYRRPTHTY